MKKYKIHLTTILTAAAVGMLLPYSATAAEGIEITPSAYLTDYAGYLTVHVQTERDIRVKIDKQTSEGAIGYYDTLLEDAGTYYFRLDSCEYDITTENYLSVFSVTVLDEKDSGCAYTQDLLVYDPGFSTEVTESAYTWSVSSVEAETRVATATTTPAAMEGSIWTGTSNVTLQYIPYTLGDVNDNDTVEMIDAYNTLLYNSIVSAGGETSFTENGSVLEENAAFSAADVNKNGVIDMVDAYYILMYNSVQSAGGKPEWRDIVK